MASLGHNELTEVSFEGPFAVIRLGPGTGRHIGIISELISAIDYSALVQVMVLHWTGDKSLPKQVAV